MCYYITLGSKRLYCVALSLMVVLFYICSYVVLLAFLRWQMKIHRTRHKQKKVEPYKRKKTINDTVGFALQLMKMIHQLRGFSHVIVEELQNG